jgi:hypothetical protein
MTDPDLLAPFRQLALRRRNRQLWLAPVGVLLGAVLAAVITPAIARHEGAPHRQLPWYASVAFVLGVLLFACLEWFVMAYVHRHRHGSWLPEPVALAGADRPTRRRVARAFRRGTVPDDPTDRALVLNLAERLRRFRWLEILALVVVVTQLLVAIFDPHRPVRILALIAAVLFGLEAVLIWLLVRRSRRILHNAGR